MKEQTLGIVLAHGAQRNQCAKHEDVWLRTCDRLVYFTPLDDCLSLPGRVEYSVGKSAAYSAHTNQRTREALRFASLTRYNWIQLVEWDSMVFSYPDDFFSEKADVYAPQFFDKGNPKFKGSFYLHFPQLYRRVFLDKVVKAMDDLPLDAEGGFTDRYVGLAVEKAELKVRDLNPTGLVYTKNRIDNIPEALEAYKTGARWSHGIKTLDTFSELNRAHSEYLAALA